MGIRKGIDDIKFNAGIAKDHNKPVSYSIPIKDHFNKEKTHSSFAVKQKTTVNLMLYVCRTGWLTGMTQKGHVSEGRAVNQMKKGMCVEILSHKTWKGFKDA